ncbi:chemotaxis protein CheW [uncultured Pseudacidovorax sp.]|uniref:chemotaxis protein CheW n=1 Tax=uncultured Pseudacidovorax sp. TaxID=679313 RepID=UPI0025FD13FF|nr:chemotaxis protein CheW [uncultured Pseudacidovorax sp.]
MAQRESLRAFQARLAERLQAAQARPLAAQWLAVHAGGRPCLLPLPQAGEIFPATTPQPVPYVKPWFLGVANLRGRLCGVIRLAHWLADSPLPADAGAQAPEGSHFVALGEGLGVNAAARVDALVGLRAASAFTAVQHADAVRPPWLGACLTDSDGRAWQVLDLQALAADPGFLHIAA